MVVVIEFRIPMPMTVSEYQIGQLYSIAEMSKESSGKNGEGVEIIANEPFQKGDEKGQFTSKIYHIGKSLPKIMSSFLPSGALNVHEEAWNAYPYCKTSINAPFLGDKFSATILSMYKDDDGTCPNALNLSKEHLAKRKIIKLDIVNDEFPTKKKENDPSIHKCTKRDIGPLTGKLWEKNQPTIMWCYKVCIMECKIWGLQNAIEAKFVEVECEVFLKLHRKIYCSMDDWIDMDMNAITEMEKNTAKQLEQINKGKGFS
ncbi:hypothetical protein AKO1_008238 [Acrasis kona]|uniref:Phosphatidylinositol transfer protein N-terminal domain-containing protein n=1 Tax=Acrasis kona TaxID=1008807 RepID=A0AAW2YPH0_9EUKA